VAAKIIPAVNQQLKIAHPKRPDINRCYMTLFTSAKVTTGDVKQAILCPPGALDRSPCGTGTSAKLACLAADGKLGEGEPWVQESIVGSRFTASYQWLDRAAGTVSPRISGTAYITAESTLLLDERDPFRFGIPGR
jgi:proline racemase